MTATRTSGPIERDVSLIQMNEILAKMVNRHCPNWLHQSREDFVQTCLTRMIDKLNQSEEKTAINTSYLAKVAYSVVVDEIRQRGRASVFSLDEEQSQEPENHQPDPEQRAVGKALGREIYECMGRLIEKRRAATMLHLQGHKIDEIAILLGRKSKQAENLIYRGMKQLRECLEGKGLKP